MILTSNGSSIDTGSPSYINVDSTNNEIPISLGQFPPSFDPYQIEITGTLLDDNETVYSAATQLFRLPMRTDGGSVTRLDNLHGGISVKKANASEWMMLFPYTYYGRWTTSMEEYSVKV